MVPRPTSSPRYDGRSPDDWMPASPLLGICAATSNGCPWPGLGCVAGAAGVARVSDYQGDPDGVAVLVCA